MGPMLMSGLALFGATIALGAIASGTSSTADMTIGSPGRNLAIILMAFVQGLAVLGVVVGILAIFAVGSVTSGEGVAAAGPSVVGAIIGIELVVLRKGDVDRGIVLVGAMFTMGLVVLGIVLAVLSFVVTIEPTNAPADWPFVLLGAVIAGSAIGIGAIGRQGVLSIGSVDRQNAKAMIASRLNRCVPLQGLGVGASVIAIFLERIH